MIKLVVCDIDGTLLKKGESEFSAEVVSALEGVFASGKKICFASGRSYFGIRRLADKLSFADEIYYICNDGAVCIYKGKTLYHKQISIENMLKFSRNPEYSGLAVVYGTDDFSYIIGGDAELVLALEKNGIDKFTPVPGVYDIKSPVYKIGVYGRSVRPQKLTPCPFELRVAYDADNIVEYTSRFANKGLAVSDLQMRLYLSKLDTAALGDGDNDVELFSKAKYTYARSDGSKTLLTVATDTFTDVAEALQTLARKD